MGALAGKTEGGCGGEGAGVYYAGGVWGSGARGEERGRRGGRVYACVCVLVCLLVRGGRRRPLVVAHTEGGDTFVMSTEKQHIHKQVHSNSLMQTPRLSLSFFVAHKHTQAHSHFSDMNVESQ